MSACLLITNGIKKKLGRQHADVTMKKVDTQGFHKSKNSKTAGQNTCELHTGAMSPTGRGNYYTRLLENVLK